MVHRGKFGVQACADKDRCQGAGTRSRSHPGPTCRRKEAPAVRHRLCAPQRSPALPRPAAADLRCEPQVDRFFDIAFNGLQGDDAGLTDARADIAGDTNTGAAPRKIKNGGQTTQFAQASERGELGTKRFRRVDLEVQTGFRNIIHRDRHAPRTSIFFHKNQSSDDRSLSSTRTAIQGFGRCSLPANRSPTRWALTSRTASRT